MEGFMIHQKLKEIREGNHLSHETMSKMLNISKTFYWQIENGKRGLTYEMAKKIANVFKLKPDDLFYNEESES